MTPEEANRLTEAEWNDAVNSEDLQHNGGYWTPSFSVLKDGRVVYMFSDGDAIVLVSREDYLAMVATRQAEAAGDFHEIAGQFLRNVVWSIDRRDSNRGRKFFDRVAQWLENRL